MKITNYTSSKHTTASYSRRQHTISPVMSMGSRIYCDMIYISAAALLFMCILCAYTIYYNIRTCAGCVCFNETAFSIYPLTPQTRTDTAVGVLSVQSFHVLGYGIRRGD